MKDVKDESPVESLLAADPKLSELVRRLVGALNPERIYLFGSRARGDATEDSDYDVLVLLDHRDEERYALQVEAYRHLYGLGAPVDVLVMQPDFYERRRIVRTSLPATIAREGKLLYAA